MGLELQKRAIGAGLPAIEILELIILAEQEIQNVAKKLGLPENATMDMVHVAIINHDVESLAKKMDLSVEQAEKYSIENQINRKLAEKLGLREDASEKDIRIALISADRKQKAQELGLPEDATVKDIREAIARKRLGLPITATQDEVIAAMRRKHDARLAIELGLPETATTEELIAAMTREHNTRSARELGLPEDASIAERIAAMDRKYAATEKTNLTIGEHRAEDIGRVAQKGTTREDLNGALNIVDEGKGKDKAKAKDKDKDKDETSK